MTTRGFRDVLEIARGILDLATTLMAGAVKEITVVRGHDVRDFALMVCRRLMGQRRDGEGAPVFAPTARLDYETELACIVGPGNPLGQRLPLEEAEAHMLGTCLLNDWSSRDIQRFEYQPLGPFLGRSFLSNPSPWVVTLEALAPFCARPRPRNGAEEPAALPHLAHPADTLAGFDIAVSAQLRPQGAAEATRIGSANARWLYWTPAQMLAQHTSNGCGLHPGDVIGAGTISGFGPEECGCLQEITENDQKPIRLSDGISRRFLEDGDEIVLTARCDRDGFVPIGFGSCRGVLPSCC